jgi:hypothetical protein
MIGRALSPSLASRACVATFFAAALFAASFAVTPAQAQSPLGLQAYQEAYDGYVLAEAVWQKRYHIDVDGSYSYARLYAYYAWYEAYVAYFYDETGRWYNVFWLEYYAAVEYYEEAFTGRRIDWPDRQTRLAFEKTYLACTLAYSVILEEFGQ